MVPISNMNKKEEAERPNTEYEVVPFEDIFLSRVEELTNLTKLVTFSVQNMTGLEKLRKVLKSDAEEIERAAEIESLAKNEVESDFALLRGSTTILLWGALETSIKDFLVRWLYRYPTSRNIPEFEKLKIRLVEFEKLESLDRMRFLLDQFERELSATLKPGIGRFDCILNPLKLKPKVPSAIRKTLNEMAAIRNVLVHKAGIADERFVSLCPGLKFEIGDSIGVSSSDFTEYLNASIEYVVAIINAVESHVMYKSVEIDT